MGSLSQVRVNVGQGSGCGVVYDADAGSSKRRAFAVVSAADAAPPAGCGGVTLAAGALPAAMAMGSVTLLQLDIAAARRVIWQMIRPADAPAHSRIDPPSDPAISGWHSSRGLDE
jgi:hypothetical protein